MRFRNQIWDEHYGWCVGLHHDPTHSSRRYLHLERLPPAHVVADFVIGLALGHLLGAQHPIPPPLAGPSATAPRAVSPYPQGRSQ